MKLWKTVPIVMVLLLLVGCKPSFTEEEAKEILETRLLIPVTMSVGGNYFVGYTYYNKETKEWVSEVTLTYQAKTLTMGVRKDGQIRTLNPDGSTKWIERQGIK